MDNYSFEQYELKDKAVLASLEREVGAEVLNQLLGIFKAESASLFSQLDDALNSSETQELTRLLHSMKSGAKSYGAARLAALADNLEAAAREGDTVSVRDNMQVLQKVLSATLECYA